MATDWDSEDLITYGQVESWTVDALNEYCRKHNFKVSGSKKE